MVWQVNLEHQSLVIKIIPARIRVCKFAKIQKTSLGDEIIVAHAEDEPLIVISDQAVDRDHAYTFPFLVEKAGVLVSAIMNAETIELGAKGIVLVLLAGKAREEGRHTLH